MSSALVLLAAPLVAGIVLLPIAALVAAGVLGGERTGLHSGALRARWAGSLLGLVVLMGIVALGAGGGPSTGPLAFGAIAAAAPGLAGLVLVLAISLGERTLPAPRTALRSASLVPRAAGDVVPRSAVILAAISLTVLLLVSAVGWSLADGGREYTTERAMADGTVITSTSSPFPGFHYLIPLWAALLLLVIAAVLALRAVLHRRPSDDEQDILLRRRSSTSVLGALVLASSLCLLPVATLLAARLAPAGGLSGALPLEQFGIGVGVLGAAAGLLAFPVGIAMVVFPEVLARRSPAGVGRREALRAVQGDRR